MRRQTPPGRLVDKENHVLVATIIVVVAFVVWGTYGYLKGKPHGLGAEGFKYSMTGVFGMKKLNERIAEVERQKRAG